MGKVWIALFVIFIVYAAIIFNLIKDFKQLPSPIFGGDYYYQLGSVYHILNSPPGDWFKSSNILGHSATYSPIYGAVVAAFSVVTGLTPIQSIFYSNFPFLLISLVTAFFLFKFITKDTKVSIIGVLVFLPFTVFPVLKYTELVHVFAIPLFLVALFRLYEKQTLKRALLLGVIYGMLTLLQPTGIIIGTAFVLFFLFYSVFSHVFENLMKEFSIASLIPSLSDKEKLVENIKKASIFFFVAFVIGFLIAQIWWFKPIFELGGKSQAMVNEWGFQDFSSFTFQFIFLFETLTQYVFNFSGLLEGAISILGLLGLWFLLFKKEESPESKFVLLTFIVSTFLTFHYFITAPLIGTYFGPNYMSFLIFKLGFILVAIHALARLAKLGVNDVKWLNGFGRFTGYLSHLMILFVLVNAVFGYDGWYNDRWKAVGRTPFIPQYSELQSYLLANTSVNDVILSSNEISFVINAISGRKAVAFRRGHVDPFSTLDDREIAAAIILYGSSQEEKIRLIKEYNISYLYYDINWVHSEWELDSKGQVAGSFDPLAVFDTPETRRVLEVNGVHYTPQRTWLDPSMRGGYFKKVDILFIDASNYKPRDDAIWKEDLDKLIQPIWKNNDGSAVLYKFTV